MTTTEFLQRELRRVELSMRRAAKKPNTPQEELRGLEEKRANLCEARAAVLEMQARPEAGEPLTLEQLRGMDGRPAYWPDDESWGIISVDDVGRWAGIPFFRGRKNGVNFEYDIVSRGMEVYAYPPAHIDREKWELCMWCVPNGQFGLNNYCSACGRPLTDEAWAELERRFFGEV